MSLLTVEDLAQLFWPHEESHQLRSTQHGLKEY